mmetsp:Transcript_47407/g.124252  ORF Transcript_47407/g.124252 Transcript_47407/m.124252 type:complete len:246 (-) Transcript_47407:845-1582(-)
MAALTICQSNPRHRCGEPCRMSSGPMLTTRQPMAPAALMAMLRFSTTSKTERGFIAPVCTARMSIVSATAQLMSLHRMTPSRSTSKRVKSSASTSIGTRCCTSPSSASASLMNSEKAIVSDSANECVAPVFERTVVCTPVRAFELVPLWSLPGVSALPFSASNTAFAALAFDDAPRKAEFPAATAVRVTLPCTPVLRRSSAVAKGTTPPRLCLLAPPLVGALRSPPGGVNLGALGKTRQREAMWS